MRNGAIPFRPRCHSVSFATSGYLQGQGDPFGFNGDSLQGAVPNSADAMVRSADSMQAHRPRRRANTLGAVLARPVSVAVVAPGGGTGINSSVYSALAHREGFSVNILGQSRAAYDRYPASWAQEGAPPPNLETFALDLLAQGSLDNLDCLVVGSRGGQAVLPALWQARGAAIPPAVVMNGGCANTTPTPVCWPESAVTFLLIGGNDYFRDSIPLQKYLSETQRYVPRNNSTTAVLLVNEMTHMPQANLLTDILHNIIRAVTSWKDSDQVPLDDFRAVLSSLRKGGWSGKLSFKTMIGDTWETEAFP